MTKKRSKTSEYDDDQVDVVMRTWRGQCGLARTFWLFWFLPSVLLALFCGSSAYGWFFGKALSLGASLGYFISLSLAVSAFIYNVFMGVATWRSAGLYQGHKIWPMAARVYIIAVVGSLIYVLYAISTMDWDDPGRDSTNITDFLEPDPAYPYIGFWKTNCADNFGLSIAKAGDGLYSVSFCGPGGCFKPGTYRPNTALVDDSDYTIVNDTTIQVKGRDGFLTYRKCPS